MSILIGLMAFLAMICGIVLLAAGLILDSQNANRPLAIRLMRIGAGAGLMGAFGMVVVAAREKFLGMTWWMVAVLVVLSAGSGIASRIWWNYRTRR
jgi:hypothetical protein